jgi:hypothetical protein
VDFDRAAFLMDKALLGEAIKAVKVGIIASHSPFDLRVRTATAWRGRSFPPRKVAPKVYGRGYCRRHREKYSAEFIPDSDPNWGG